MPPSGFEWNEEKAQFNLRKHGVAFTEAITVFDDPTTLNNNMREEYDFSHATRGNPYQHLVKRPITIETTDGSHYSVSIKTIELTATVAPNGTLTLQLPPDITPGEHRITLLIQE
jgi:hypothetical protein